MHWEVSVRFFIFYTDFSILISNRVEFSSKVTPCTSLTENFITVIVLLLKHFQLEEQWFYIISHTGENAKKSTFVKNREKSD